MNSNGQVSVVGQLGTGKYSVQKVKQVLDMIDEETRFMQEARDEMSALPCEQRAAMHTSTVLQFIGVKSAADLDLLVGLFLQGHDDDGGEGELDIEPFSTLTFLTD